MRERTYRIQPRPHTRTSSEVLLAQLREDIKALNSAVSIISQKMKHLTRNEKILGRNLIVLNKKIKELSERSFGSEMSEETEKKLNELTLKLQDMEAQLGELRSELSYLKNNSISMEKFKELQFIVQSINPTELATIEQVKEMLSENKKKKE